MICLHCGKQIPDGTGICPYCGNKVEENEPTAALHTPEKSGKGKAGIIIVAAIALVAVLCLVFFGGVWVRSLDWLPMLALTGVFALFFTADLLGHKFLRISRKFGHWCLLTVVTAGMVCAAVGTLMTLGGTLPGCRSG